jgi:DNA replication ATP-dependent helicase Dna2
LVPVSEKTKNKLQKFQFLPPSAEVDDSETRRHDSEPNEADKENDVPLTRANSTPTPATRLVWQDLMGETKDEPCEEDDEAPAEQLLWHNDRDEVSQRISPMIGRRKRKRARSSSPASSPSNAMPATPAVNVKQLSQALRTPNADPTLQLWDRFALPGGNGASPSGLTNPMMAHLLVSSSPRPLKHGGGTPHQQSEGSLRRAISCGTQWPKRRKTFGSEPLSKVTISGSPNGDSKSSLVSALLKTVTGELNKSTYSKGGEGVPRLPSAQGGAHSRRDTPYESPSERALAVNKAAGSRPVVHGDAGESTGHSKSAGTSSSDYGDDDFDDDTLLELDATVYTIPDEELSTAVSVKNTAMFGEEDENTTAMDEDFGDFDDDLLDAAEDIMATAASQHPCKRENATHHSQTPSKQLTSTLMEQEDDTYSDDLGDIDFDAVELAATQSASRAAPSHPHVRTAVHR